MNDKRQLLCTFSSLKTYKDTIEEIKKFYKVFSDRFFVFTNVNSPNEVLVTYNIINNGELSKFPNTISIHRKKQYNVLYSLNCMNKIIQDENGGVFDSSFAVNWLLYSDSFITLNNNMIKIVPIKLLEIFI